MNLYFAPMEGITTYTYRNTHHELFGGCDAYYAPFIVPTDNEKITLRTLRDIKCENNTAPIKPQILCSSETAFDKFVQKILPLGYDELNLNLGCPSGTVVKKGRGAGALKNTEELERFLDKIFLSPDIKISVKTRTGFYSHDEFETLMRIFNKYPISELIIHPRVREEYYKGMPNMKSFDVAYSGSGLRLCYNGNIYTIGDYKKITDNYPNISSVMIGRGAIRNPAIFREIRGGARLKTKELIEFTDILAQKYLKLLGSDRYTLHRLKEIWLYSIDNYPEEKKIMKLIKKSNKLSELILAVNMLPELE